MYLLLTEAGEGIGFGHLTRMIAVGEALHKLGVNLRMLVQWEGEPSESILEGRTWISSCVWRQNPVAKLMEFGANAALIDSYRLNINGYIDLKNSGIKLAVMDDFYRLAYPADVIINPNCYGVSSAYQNHAKQAIGGQEYVILRGDVAGAAGSFVVREKCNRVLLTLGGSDIKKLGFSLSIALAEQGWQVNWIAPNHRNKQVPHPNVSILGTQTALGFINSVRDVDVVLCGGGQSLHEIACIGAPCVAIELGDDQRLNLQFYENAGFLKSRLQCASSNLIQDMLQQFEFMISKQERERLSKIGSLMIDGKGVHRVAKMLKRLVK